MIVGERLLRSQLVDDLFLFRTVVDYLWNHDSPILPPKLRFTQVSFSVNFTSLGSGDEQTIRTYFSYVALYRKIWTCSKTPSFS